MSSVDAPSVYRVPRTRLEMPFLLICVMGFCAFAAVVGTLAYLGIVLALFSDGPFNVNGHPVTRAGFIRAIWPLLVVFPPMLAGAAAAAYGLRRERPWSRRLLLDLGFLNAVLTLGLTLADGTPDNLVAAGMWCFVIAGVPAWYLYRKATVVAYFRAVSASSGAQGSLTNRCS